MEVFSGERKRRHEYFLKIMQKKIADLKNVHRIILVGTGESGKSTFVKQMKLLSSPNQSFPESYRVNFILEIHRNLVQALASTAQFMEKENMPLKSSGLVKAKNLVWSIKEEIDRLPDSISQHTSVKSIARRNAFFQACALLWADPTIRDTAAMRGNEYLLLDSALYFLNKIHEVSDPSYKPSDDDVLQCRTKTLGIHTESIVLNSVNFELVDVGGQRDQRAKWIEAMSDGVTAVIFLTDVSAFDMKLAEDESVNRLRDSINLLGQVWKNNLLSDKSIILFLNKQDKLTDKLRNHPGRIEQYFPEYAQAKVVFLIELIRSLQIARTTKGKRESDIWNEKFSYFLPPLSRRTSILRQGTPDLSQSGGNRESRVLTEYNQVQSMIVKAFNDNLINNWINVPMEPQDTMVRSLNKMEDFVSLQQRLSAIPFYELVSVTRFLQNMFVNQCDQTIGRQIYAFPTTAIDKRNVYRVFDSCRDILQGKAMEAMLK